MDPWRIICRTLLFAIICLIACKVPSSGLPLKPLPSDLKQIIIAHPEIVYASLEANPRAAVAVIKGTIEKAQYEEELDAAVTNVIDELKRPTTAELAGRAAYGPVDAPVTIVEWGDFACIHCQTAFGTMMLLRNEYAQKIRIVYKQLPVLMIESRLASEYMEAIALQDKNKALRFYELMYPGREEFLQDPKKFVEKVAKIVGANMRLLHRDYKGHIVKHRIDVDMQEAKRLECNGTPCFLINGAIVHGAYPFEFFKRIADFVLSIKHDNAALLDNKNRRAVNPG